MLLDLLKTDDWISYNKKIAHILGLHEAIYINQVINIMGKAIVKDKIFDEGYVKLNREYIFEQTTLTLEEQLRIDDKLSDINLLLRNFENPDLVKIDIELLASINTEDDLNVVNDISKKVSAKKGKIDRATKGHYIGEKLKSFVDTGNDELNNAIKLWIDSIITNKGYLTKEIVTKFENDLNSVTMGNLNQALDIVNVATVYNYREVSWAVNMYDREKSMMKNKVVKEHSENLSQKKF